MAIPAIMAASNQADLYVDACEKCDCNMDDGPNHDNHAFDQECSARTCHPGPDWLEVEPFRRSDDDGESSSSDGESSGVDAEENISIFNSDLLIPLFKLPSNKHHFGDDVCLEMEQLVFGLPPSSVCVAPLSCGCGAKNPLWTPWFSTARDGDDSILHYWRWVKFAVEVEGDFSGRKKGAEHRRWKNGPWVCCVLAAQDEPFVDGSKYDA